MTILFAVIAVVCFGILIAVLVTNKKLENQIAAEKQETERQRQYYEAEAARISNEAKQEIERKRQFYEGETARVYGEAQTAVVEAQKLIDQQSNDLKQESERIRQHFEIETRKSQEAAETLITKVLKEVEPLRKFEKLGNTEAEVVRQLADALKEANAMKTEAASLLELTRLTSANERSAAILKAKDIHEQADARLNQAIRDAGSIMAKAEERAQEIGGDAYAALKDKQMLEEAAEAMRNIIEGYGDRYLVPTHSLLDDLAAEYGYDAAGQSLASAREQSKRMVEQGEAAACDYVEANRRNTAIQFVIHAFNGSVDATLTRVKSDNYGILEQRIRDCFSIVNRDGSAFRNARILPAYLDVRLAELKWAVVVQELAARDREEQRYLKEQERDRQKAEQERQKQLRDAEREKELIRVAKEEAEKRLAAASAEQKAVLEKEVQEWRQKFEDATKHELTIAQQTNKGRIYIISNVGSFGESVYKIGLTRRPAEERIDELNSASVPFEFDIHAVIETDNAPALEYKIHHHFFEARLNKINLRKEFFRVSLGDIRGAMAGLTQGKDFNGSVTWTEKAKAQQYYDSLNIDRDPNTKEKWMLRAKVIAKRRERSSIRLEPGTETTSDSNEET